MATAEGSASQDQDRDDRSARVGRLTRQKVQLYSLNAASAFALPHLFCAAESVAPDDLGISCCAVLCGAGVQLAILYAVYEHDQISRPEHDPSEHLESKRQVRVSRKRILDSAAKVMELYGSSRAVLELEFFGEVRRSPSRCSGKEVNAG